MMVNELLLYVQDQESFCSELVEFEKYVSLVY